MVQRRGADTAGAPARQAPARADGGASHAQAKRGARLRTVGDRHARAAFGALLQTPGGQLARVLAAYAEQSGAGAAD